MTAALWVLAGVAVAGLLGGLHFGAKEDQRREKELQTQREQAFLNSQNTLSNIAKEYKTTGTLIEATEGKLRGIDTFFEGYQMEWDQQVGTLELELGRVDSLLGNWQNSYDAQTKSMEAQGKDTLYNLMQNYSLSEVAAADRGMGGSMNLVSQQEKQKVIDFAGADMSLGGGGGLYGASYATLVSNLHAEQDYLRSQQSILGGSLDLAKFNLQSQYDEQLAQQGELTGALGRYQNSLIELEKDYEKQYNQTISDRNKAGRKDQVKKFGEII